MSVLTVPMRNGNHLTAWAELTFIVCSYRTYEEWKLCSSWATNSGCWRVLTVPMRNGNSTFQTRPKAPSSSSYRTYEEWKLSHLLHSTIVSSSSYRTYEEWKPSTHILSHLFIIGSYRTYEEWKLKYLLMQKKSLKVLTVPMRNGNCGDERARKRINTQFLPYLWGMETEDEI